MFLKPCGYSDTIQTGVCKNRSEDVAIRTARGFQHQNSTHVHTEHFDRHKHYINFEKYKSSIIIIITLFKSQIILAEHECSTNWGDCKSNKSNQINQVKCWFLGRGENRSTRRKTSRSGLFVFHGW